MTDLQLPGAAVSALARSADGDVVAAEMPDRALAPASNTKTVACALALDRFGPDHRFETTVRQGGRRSEPDLADDLVLCGVGAPDLSTEDLGKLADHVAAERSDVDGDLLVDGSHFSTERIGPGWTYGDVRHAYGAPSSAVALAGNVVTVTVAAERDQVTASVTPDSAAISLDLDVTVAEDADPTDEAVEATTDPRTGRILVSGLVPPNESRTVSAPVQSPERHAGLVFRRLLAERDVTVAGEVVTTGGRPEVDEVVGTVESAPLSGLIRSVLVPSDNFGAENLARAVAAATGDGAWEVWEGRVRDHFDSLGVETVRVRDGSGLSRYNRLPARGLVEHLEWAQMQSWWPTFRDALPTPGEGTLSGRLEGVPVAAKTGSLTGTRALTGVVDANDRLVTFAVICSDLTTDESSVTDRIDAWVRSL